jgi:hypothetical protein
MKTKVSAEEFAKVKKFFDLAEIAFVENPAPIQPILHVGLTSSEMEKAVRLEPALSEIFRTHKANVRYCSGEDDPHGESRTIFFNTPSKDDISVAMMPAHDFISLPDREVLATIEMQVTDWARV